VRSIKRVAASGRSIVCTIHQPSSLIFNSFDTLLLLKAGGKMTFFGELGVDNELLIKFFSGAPSVVPIKQDQNPATWMLEVTGAGTSMTNANTVDFGAFYNDSDLCKENLHHTDQVQIRIYIYIYLYIYMIVDM
jgi:ABC-type multidrug transport system ATPase subunit